MLAVSPKCQSVDRDFVQNPWNPPVYVIVCYQLLALALICYQVTEFDKTYYLNCVIRVC